ncbi:MAG TPA: dienelactone hydrolase family protein [Rhodothermales bacterium]|nr:dienelactone hydrolase family protein [Rhodothermales bacterium]
MRDTLNDMQLYLVEEFVEDYQEGHLTRREALRRIAAVTGSVAFATSVLAACGTTEPSATPAPSTPPATSPTAPSAAPSSTPAAPTGPDPAVHVRPDDPAITAGVVTFPGEGATLTAYLARPRNGRRQPLILVCHENRGLTPHIEDVTRRVAKAGYVGLAVDLLSRSGGTAAVTAQGQVPQVLGQLPPEQAVQDFQAGLRYAQGQSFVDGARVGMTGFCYGGGVTWRVATRTPELRAAVPFYGPPPRAEEVPGIRAAVLAIYGETDQRINAMIPDIEAAMQANGKVFEKVIYPGVGHGFHNDTGRNYNAEAARAAWARTLAWFERYVRG